jgi:hypothetical protein
VDRTLLVPGGNAPEALQPVDQTLHQVPLSVCNREDGEILGEIALLANVPRTATVRALTPCILLALASESFDKLLMGAPELRAVIQRIAESRLQNLAQ